MPRIPDHLRDGDPVEKLLLHLPDACRTCPGVPAVVYGRVSSYGQAGRGKKKLEEKTAAVVAEVSKFAHVEKIVIGIEDGRLSKPRPKLKDAARYAKENGCILVAADLSRLIRAEAYSRRSNRNAMPTVSELIVLHALTENVLLATVERPDMQEDERHSKATKRTGKAGRRRTIDDELAAQIFDVLGEYVHFRGRWRWRGAMKWKGGLRGIAKHFGVSEQAILRAADRPSPNGQSWRCLAEAAGVDWDIPPEPWSEK
jgi:hypothetical protein